MAAVDSPRPITARHLKQLAAFDATDLSMINVTGPLTYLVQQAMTSNAKPMRAGIEPDNAADIHAAVSRAVDLGRNYCTSWNYRRWQYMHADLLKCLETGPVRNNAATGTEPGQREAQKASVSPPEYVGHSSKRSQLTSPPIEEPPRPGDRAVQTASVPSNSSSGAVEQAAQQVQEMELPVRRGLPDLTDGEKRKVDQRQLAKTTTVRKPGGELAVADARPVHALQAGHKSSRQVRHQASHLFVQFFCVCICLLTRRVCCRHCGVRSRRNALK